MPIHKIHWYNKGEGWAVWELTEDAQTLAAALPQADQCPDQISNWRKRLEWLGGRYLVSMLLREAGEEYHGLEKDEFGKPYPVQSNYFISLSNSYPFVAAQIHRSIPVGIDLEIPRLKMEQVVPRVLSETEKADAGGSLDKLCIYWSAKESLFKIYGKKTLMFSTEISVDPFLKSKSGLLKGVVFASNEYLDVELDYFIEPDYILTTTKSVKRI